MSVATMNRMSIRERAWSAMMAASFASDFPSPLYKAAAWWNLRLGR